MNAREVIEQNEALKGACRKHMSAHSPLVVADNIVRDLSKAGFTIMSKEDVEAVREALEHAADAEPFESCPDCAGSGYSNHPDSGQVCYRCDGQGSYAHPGILRELITDLLSHLNPSDPETLPLTRRAMEALR